MGNEDRSGSRLNPTIIDTARLQSEAQRTDDAPHKTGNTMLLTPVAGLEDHEFGLETRPEILHSAQLHETPVEAQLLTPPPFDEAIDLPASEPEIFDNRYQVEEKLGEGGMGMVCRVRCLRLGKDFALKRMLATIADDPGLRETFYQEARLASSLTHPNIVSIVDYGEDPKLGAYMVMELAQGEMLSMRLSKGAMPTRTMIEVILQIADALKHIHSKGIVHGDIKPDNILLHRAKHSDRRRWQVMLLDFGLATLRSDSKRRDRVNGTPEYMAPERIQGVAPTPAQDIYALGMLAYQLTTGRLPFEGDVATILDGHLYQNPPPFSSFLDEEVDPRLEKLIFKAIERKPEDRHPNMAAFIYELRTLVDMLGLGRKRGFRTAQSSTLDLVRDKIAAAAASGFNAAPLPLAVVTDDGIIQAVNPAFVRFLGKSEVNAAQGESVATDRFLHLVPTLLEELRRTREAQKRTTFAVKIEQSSSTTTLRVCLAPAGGNTVLISVHVEGA